MRSFATVLSQFWTGRTGKAITAAGKDARIVSTYLLTCEHANMLGLYRLPMLYAAEETGLKHREVAAALKQLQGFEFAYYDEATEFVWVSEMARFQLGLLPGETLKEGDKRAKGAARLYKQISSNPFLGPFHDRYSQILGLPFRRDFLAETETHASPFEGASEPLARGYGPGLDLDRKGDTGETRTPSSSPSGLTPQQIQERWNAIPGVKPCKEIGKTIRAEISRRITEHAGLDWWDNFFKLVRASDFLCGRTNGTRGPYRVSLAWILTPANLDKLLAGDYDPIASSSHSQTLTCTKRVQSSGDNFLHSCGQPASEQSRHTEPRCTEHLSEANRAKELTYAAH